MKISIHFKVLWDSFGDDKEKERPLRSCIHSGNAGDIIYSLPTVKELKAEHYVINLCSDPGFGGRNIDFPTAKSLAPLLLAQPYIKRVTIVSNNLPLEYANEPVEEIDFILDKFRLHEPLKHHLAISHAMPFGINVNLYEKWLYIDDEKPYRDKDYVVISLTPRYRSLPKEYWIEVLAGLDNLVVIGIPEEFHTLSGITADFVTCTDFLEMAKMIQGCRLFIGNPNLPYAIAEGLKVQRIVELHSEFQNAYPIGRSGYIAPSSIVEARDLIHRLIPGSSTSALKYQNTTLLRKTVDLEAVIKDKDVHIGNLDTIIRDKEAHISNIEVAIREKDTHIGNLERQREENYRDWQAHTKNLELVIEDKEAHIGNLERQREENYRDWQANEKNLKTVIKNRESHVENLNIVLLDKEQHIKNLEHILQDKEAHIGNLERQREENYRDWQAQLKELNKIIKEKEQENLKLKMSLGEKNHQIELLEHPKGFREKVARIWKILKGGHDG